MINETVLLPAVTDELTRSSLPIQHEVLILSLSSHWQYRICNVTFCITFYVPRNLLQYCFAFTLITSGNTYRRLDASKDWNAKQTKSLAMKTCRPSI